MKKITRMTPEYDKVLFNHIYDSADKFVKDYHDTGIKTTITDQSATLLFYLLYARYGNNPIANNDITQWKYKIFSIVFQYGPTWEKRLEIQEKLRGLSDDDIRSSYKAIVNHAFNPSTAPATSSLEELQYINEQNTNTGRKGVIDAYAQLWQMLKVDVTDNFLDEFKSCFKIFVAPEDPLLYITVDEDDDTNTYLYQGGY